MSEQVIVTRVIDGDTFEGKRVSSMVSSALFGGAKPEEASPSMAAISDALNPKVKDEVFRLLNLDTPEVGYPGYGDAKNALTDLLDGKDVMIEGDVKDKYGRTLVNVTTQKIDSVTLIRATIDVNAAMEKYDKKHQLFLG